MLTKNYEGANKREKEILKVEQVSMTIIDSSKYGSALDALIEKVHR